MDINYSIIIPHKNIPDLLQRCLDSIPKREDIQIIIVDDNSDEEKVDFNSFPGMGERCVEVYLTKEGKGAGYARNVGLRHAKGKWLLFADADDLYLEGAFDLCDKYLNCIYDIVYFGIDSVDSETGKRVDRYKVYNKYIVACDNVSLDLINMLKFRHDVPWGKMIRHDLVANNNIRFGETRFCNDTLFSTLTALNAVNVYADKTAFYCVTERTGSLITHSTKDAYFIRYEVILKKNMILREHGLATYQLSIAFYLRKIFRYGLLDFIRAIKLGVKYKANFLVGYQKWFRLSN